MQHRAVLRSVLFSIILASFALLFTGCGSGSCRQAHMEMAVLWQQQAAEAKALFYQGYNVARSALDRGLAGLKAGEKAAVVLDLDETVLDNSPYQVARLKAGKSFDLTSWNDWCNLGQAPLLPGAREFLQYADSKGVAIFYISNRYKQTAAGTLANLKKKGIPQALPGRLLLRDRTSSKKARRAQVSREYRILLLCGDNLGDFSELFDSKRPAPRLKALEKMKNRLGSEFIVFPNPMYGSWEGAVYRGKWGASAQAKRQMRLDAMKGF